MLEYDTAYAVLIQHSDSQFLLSTLISVMLIDNKVVKLVALFFLSNLHPAIDVFLLQRVRSSPTDVQFLGLLPHLDRIQFLGLLSLHPSKAT
jgi:hypothetical protein